MKMTLVSRETFPKKCPDTSLQFYISEALLDYVESQPSNFV